MRDANIISREGRARPLELMSMGHLHKIYLRKWTGLEIVWGHILIKWAPMVFHARLKICVLTSIMYSRANAKKLPLQKNVWPFLLNFVIMSSLHKCNFFQPIILKPQQDSSGPIFTFMSGLCTLPLIFASLEQQKSGKSFYWCFWKECIKMGERGRNRKCINAGYGACVRSMIPHYTQIMQSPSLLHAAALRTNKTTSGATHNLTKTQKHKYTNTPVHSIYLLDICRNWTKGINK